MNSTSLNPFIDRKTVRWADVKEVQHTLVQHFHYDYPGPIRNLTHRLMIMPRSQYGDQQRCDFNLDVSPDMKVTCKRDLFGNEVLTAKAKRLESPLVFEMHSTVTRSAEDVPVCISSDEADHFRSPTRLTFADEYLSGVAHGLEVIAQDDLSFAEAASNWVSKAMRYGFRRNRHRHRRRRSAHHRSRTVPRLRPHHDRAVPRGGHGGALRLRTHVG